MGVMRLASASFWLGGLSLPLALFLVGARPCAAQGQSKDTSDWLSKAAEITNIEKPGMRPFRMRGKVRILGDKDQLSDGTFELLWNSPSQWQERLEFPGYSRARTGGDHKYWVQRNMLFEIPRAEELDKLLDFGQKLRIGSNEKFGKTEQKKENGAARTCVELDRSVGSAKRVLCFDPVSGALASEENLQSGAPSIYQSAQISRSEYSDFRPWEGHTYPYRMAGFSGKKTAVELDLEELSPLENAASALFDVPKDSEEWDICDTAEQAALSLSAQPVYPEEARRNRETGVVQIYAVIETDGTLSHLQVVTHAKPDLDRAALEAVSQWRYRPPSATEIPFGFTRLLPPLFGCPNSRQPQLALARGRSVHTPRSVRSE
jgi:TonB family protein